MNITQLFLGIVVKQLPPFLSFHVGNTFFILFQLIFKVKVSLLIVL